MLSRGPAEILSGPASTKKASSVFAQQEWKKCFCASEITEHTFYKKNLVLPAGTIFNSWVNEVSIFSSQPLDFKRDHTFSRFLVVFLCPV